MKSRDKRILYLIVEKGENKMGGIGAHKNAASQQSNNLGQPQIVQLQTQAQQANDQTFSDTDDSDYHELYNGRQYYQSQTFPIDTQYAIQDYLSDKATVLGDNGAYYSVSQDLNYAMEQGKKLTANQQYMADSLNDGMHNIGYNVNLTHFGRVGLIDGIGTATGVNINSTNFQNMTQAQLKLVILLAKL